MKRQATVVERQGKLMAEVVRTEACHQCRACEFGQTESVFVDLPAGNYRPGEQVELTLEEGRVTLASLIAYGLPVVLLFAGLVIASALGLREVWQAVSAFGGLAIGLIAIKILEPKLRRFQPQARPCDKKEE
ncbi:MAG: SoxR reducing system RseC family protein [Clostridiales bacterium]|nr:SoxR reducing system RseC family protein [Clostridiales bacterium]OQA26420.1 MAG: Positive regulator of sigma(E), RseC/MucC [Verrucomicrobia bacterium ADurb.Bin345]